MLTVKLHFDSLRSVSALYRSVSALFRPFQLCIGLFSLFFDHLWLRFGPFRLFSVHFGFVSVRFGDSLYPPSSDEKHRFPGFFSSLLSLAASFIAATSQVVKYVHTSQYIGEFEMLILSSQIVIGKF